MEYTTTHKLPTHKQRRTALQGNRLWTVSGETAPGLKAVLLDEASPLTDIKSPVLCLLTVPRRFLCCSFSLFVRWWFYMWCGFCHSCSANLLLSVPQEGCASWLYHSLLSLQICYLFAFQQTKPLLERSIRKTFASRGISLLFFRIGPFQKESKIVWQKCYHYKVYLLLLNCIIKQSGHISELWLLIIVVCSKQES